MNIDDGFRNLENYQNQINDFRAKDLTETDTRSKILDFLLTKVLFWEENQIEREGHVRTGFYDYEIITPTFRFLIEAKRNLIDFILPSKGNIVKLRTIYKSNQEVIDQIRSYLFERSLQFGVITNGHQFLVAKFTNSDGSDWKDNDCIFFDGLDEIKKHFTFFYELLGRESVTEFGRIKIESTRKFSKRLVYDSSPPHSNEKLNRNNLSAQLIPILKKFFEELYNTKDLSDKDLLKQCYVSNEDTQKYTYELASVFSDNPPVFDQRISPVQNTKNTQKQIKEELFHSDTNYTPDPIILIGTAGAGKTTFIKNFIELELSEEEKKDRPIIYLDFRGKTSQQIDNTSQIYQEIINLISENYPNLNLHQRSILETIYKEDIKSNKEGIWSNVSSDSDRFPEKVSSFLEERIKDPINHLQKISRYLIRQVRKKLCIVFDNADQLNEKEQNKVFILAHSINRTLNCLAITSLREGYFYRWKDKSPFNAYHSTVFHITAPPYREVLKKRINYVLNNFNFEEIKLLFDTKKVEFQKGSLKHLFTSIYRSLFNQGQSEILQFLEQTSYPNIRFGLENFQTFLLSGHTKINEYMSFDQKTIPVWEFIKSIALDFDFYYNSQSSRIKNLFYPSSTGSNHFTKTRILHYLNNEAKAHGGKTNVFTNTKILIDDFIKSGYTKDVIIVELDQLLTMQMIFTSNYSSDIEEEVLIDEDTKIHISPVGHYYISTFIKKFTYIDLALQDTPIFDELHYEKLIKSFPTSDKHGQRDLRQRVECSKLFLKYLENQENEDLKRHADIHFTNEAFHLKIMENIKSICQRDDFNRIERFLPPLTVSKS